MELLNGGILKRIDTIFEKKNPKIVDFDSLITGLFDLEGEKLLDQNPVRCAPTSVCPHRNLAQACFCWSQVTSTGHAYPYVRCLFSSTGAGMSNTPVLLQPGTQAFGQNTSVAGLA